MKTLIPFLSAPLLHPLDPKLWFLEDSANDHLVVRLAELGFLDDALGQVQDFDNAFQHMEVWKGIAPFLSNAHLDQAMEIASDFDNHDRELVLGCLLPRMAELGRPQEALVRALQMQNEEWRRQTIAAMAPFLGAGGLRQALRNCQTIDDAWAQHNLLVEFAAYGSDELLREALSRLEAGVVPDSQELALTRFGEERGTDSQSMKLLMAAIHRIEDQRARAKALLALVPFGEPLDQEGFVREVFGVTWEGGELVKLARALVRLLPSLAEPLVDWVRAVGFSSCWNLVYGLNGSINNLMLTHVAGLLAEFDSTQTLASVRKHVTEPNDRPLALARLVPHLAEPERNEVIAEVLAITEQISNPYTVVITLGKAADELAEPLLRHAVSTMLEKCKTQECITELASFAARLAQLGYPCEALSLIERIPTDRPDALTRALTSVACHPPRNQGGEILSEAMAVACQIINPKPLGKGRTGRARALLKLAEQLKEIPPNALNDIWQKACVELANYTRAELLSDLGALAPVLATLGGTKAVGEAWCAVQDVGRWWP